MKRLHLKLHAWLSSIRDGFITLLPLTFFRVLAELIQHLPWPAYQQWMTNFFGGNWHVYLSQIVNSTNYIFGIALAVLVAVHLARQLRGDEDDLPALIVGVSALINFMLYVFAVSLSSESFGIEAIFLGILIGICTAELLTKLVNTRWLNVIRMPYETDSTFYYAIKLTPAVIVVGVVALICAQSVMSFPTFSQHALAPLASWMQQQAGAVWWFNLVAALVNQVFWFIGLHGGLIMDAYAGDLFLSAGLSIHSAQVWRPSFDSFILLGGSGATLGLLLAIILVAKEGSQRKIGQLSILPSIFNINDVLLYGLPIVLNPRYFLPFIGVPILLTLLVVGAFELGVVTLVDVELSWTTPIFISGWLLTESWRGVALQLVEVAISVTIYLPFVRRAEKHRIFKEERAFVEATKAIVSDKSLRVASYRRKDQVGMVARGLLSDLRMDVSRGKLFLVYQPKHNKKGQVIGVEALLRWPHLKHRFISPEVAVTLAEESGDIHQLGIWVLEQACACKARWNKGGYAALTMAVNVSPVQLTNPALAQQVEACLQAYNLTPSEIELEITESSVILDDGAVDQTLKGLAATGVGLVMDDFGMGYSSLRYLSRFKVKAIKIDGSLTRNVLSNNVQAEIVRSIASLGSSQKVDVVAEYVETQEQRDALAEMGCNVFQGYLHSPPLLEKDCAAYFQR